MTHASAATDPASRDLAGDIGRRVAAYRAERGLRVAELAREIGVTPSLISQIERGQSRPSVSTLFALAQALDVPVDAFFREPVAASPPASMPAAAGQPQPTPGPDQHLAEARYVVRQGNRATIDIEGGVRWERLTPETMAHLDFFELVYGPGAESNPTLYSHPGTEMVLMLTGRLDISVGFETYRLAPGDSMQFPSSLPHRYANPDRTEACAVTVIMYDCPADVPTPPAAPVHR
jgi:transcriptional regulator with XRE-family HTH domain/quercetin dioxygenase-like cupin family protein